MEIEVKARLRNKEEVIEKLKELGCVFSAPKIQDDMVWVEKTGTLEEFLSNKVFLRIRVQNGTKIILTAKKSKTATGDGSLVKREHEVVIDNLEEMRGILEMLGLKEAVRVVKTRLKTSLNGFEICLDDIQDLGSFIELERMGTAEEAEQIQKEMYAFFAEIDVTPDDYIRKGYDILKLEKQSTY